MTAINGLIPLTDAGGNVYLLIATSASAAAARLYRFDIIAADGNETIASTFANLVVGGVQNR